MGIKIVKREGNSFKEKLYIPAIFGGMKTTLRHFLTNLSDTSKVKTFSYPEEQPRDITSRYRGVHRLTKREDESIRCVACFMCATACPAECIFIEAKERDDGVDEKMPEVFTIDLLECVFCGGCVEACPCDAIRMDTGIFSFVAKAREDFMLTKEKLLSHEPKKESE
ncbi:NuoI/complex I 23 kDa subunit family protein [Sulfurospirillum barnesii]|uniref:NADH-quinone oxidoreductase subunit I n=1 Tax=Sulfurospirillum barnesii (strain ATCC 700032 / DSM 10660 / SES-3) TaxID=760154 RepID=I3XUU9_SULBS|nr:NADH-quinone oxidoreductase subunit I [Sulfurospirillum barnesii]AFL67723.1 NADH:ubiquinone oxidoreductase chain I-like protein [Sulfurospirillum barnesii SES-3]